MSPLDGPLAVFDQFSHLLDEVWQRRRGCLGPRQVLMTVMAMSIVGDKGYARTLDDMKGFFHQQRRWEKGLPSPQALSQARRKLSSETCREVAHNLRALCKAARLEATLGYADMRVMSLDGTKLALPAYASLRNHFGCPVQAPDGPQASLTLLWDVGAKQPVDWQLGPYRVCERVHALTLVKALGPGDLLLGDRNFASRRIMLALREQRADWLMRVRSAGNGTLTEVEAFVATGRADTVMEVVIRDHRGKPKPDTTPLKVRLLRRVSADGSIAVFITSLVDQRQHPAADLLAIYDARWRIETAFREMKVWHGLERFHARYPDGIAQEVAVVLIFLLLVSELEAQTAIHHRKALAAAAAASKPAEIRFNRRRVGDHAVYILIAGTRGRTAVRTAFKEAMFDLWRSRQKVRPRRTFPRVCKSTRRGWHGPSKRGSG